MESWLRMAKQVPYVCVMFAVLQLHGATASSFCQQVVAPHGYGCTEFTVETDDGYVLAMHRLSRTNSFVGSGNRRASAPTDRMSPEFAPAAVESGQIDSQAPEGRGGAPAATMIPADSSKRECVDDSAMLSAAAEKAPTGKKQHTGREHRCDSANATHTKRRPHKASPSAPHASVTSNRTSDATSPVQAVVTTGPAPTSTQSTAPSPTRKQRQSTTSGGSPSNYTANPEAGNGSPVLLMHQEFFNGETWFQFVDPENRSSSLLPIMLLNDGFDVWIGHQRATYWSHGHVHLKPTDREYWNWTWDQQVQFDLPAQLLFISTETNQPVHFIGLSQAATVGLAAATDHKTAEMIQSLTLVGPTAYRGYTNSLLLEAWAYYFGLAIDSEFYATGFQNGAFNYTSEFPQSGPLTSQGITNIAIALISGPNCCIGPAPIRFSNGWDGTTSFKNLLQWQQGIRTNTFAQFDYGNPARNMQAYGRATPPTYNVGAIPSRLPILVLAAGRDWFAPPQGIRLLMSQLQQQATLINMTNYAHYDLEFSTRRETDVYLPILRYLEEGPN